jgi:16S rRNA (cytosine1402-N4)-methyltransferase
MSIHIPVLLNEIIDSLNLKEDSVVVDATLGGGGHSEAILNKIGEKGKLVAIDLDGEAIKRFKITNPKFQIPNKFQILNSKIQNAENIFLVNDNFANLENILKSLNIDKVDAILADLGWSSDQLEGRGMSFMKDELLDMRLDKKDSLTAEKIVNEYSQKDLERIIREYGEERFLKNIAKKIVEYRKNKTIKTTGELSQLIGQAIPKRFHHGKLNPATRTFQAIRIEVNHELENLKKFIPQAVQSLNQKGRLAIISFHSLEDRIVKNIFRENAGGCVCPPAAQLQELQEKYLADIEKHGSSAINLEKALRAGPSGFPQCLCGQKPKVKIITRKPVRAGEKEIETNPRARSAKLRVISTNYE